MIKITFKAKAGQQDNASGTLVQHFQKTQAHVRFQWKLSYSEAQCYTRVLPGDFGTIAMSRSVCGAYMCFVRGQIYFYGSQTEQLNGFKAPHSHSVTDN